MYVRTRRVWNGLVLGESFLFLGCEQCFGFTHHAHEQSRPFQQSSAQENQSRAIAICEYASVRLANSSDLENVDAAR